MNPSILSGPRIPIFWAVCGSLYSYWLYVPGYMCQIFFKKYRIRHLKKIKSLVKNSSDSYCNCRNGKTVTTWNCVWKTDSVYGLSCNWNWKTFTNHLRQIRNCFSITATILPDSITDCDLNGNNQQSSMAFCKNILENFCAVRNIFFQKALLIRWLRK